MKTKEIYILSVSALFIILMMNTSVLNAQFLNRGWSVGTSILYNMEMTEKGTESMTNSSLIMEYEYSAKANVRINITEIDEINNMVTLSEQMADYTDSYVTTFDPNIISIDLADDLFYFYYYWDSNLNKVQLSSFNMYGFALLPFVHPNWTIFNENLKVVLKSDRIISAVNTGYTIEYIYMSDFLSEVSFVINGKSTIAEANDSFTPDKSKWRFEFELSNYIIDRDYNHQLDIYEYWEYDEYKVILEIDYASDGVLSKISYSKIYQITKDNERYRYEDTYSMMADDTGTKSINYNLVSVLLVLFLLPTILPFRRKKK